MGFLKNLFGPKLKPETEPETITPTPVQPGAIVPNYGFTPVNPEIIDPGEVEQLQHQALNVARMNALFSQRADVVESLVEQYQQLYGRQVQHQSRLQQMHRDRFPIELMAAGLMPNFAQQAPGPAQQKASKVRSKARKILND